MGWGFGKTGIGRSMSFEFEYESSSGDHGRRRPTRTPMRAGQRPGGMIWILWFCVSAIGAGVSLAIASRVGEVRVIGDVNFWTALTGIAVVISLSVPGFSMYWLVRSSAHPNWHERVWRPTALVGLSMLSSVGAALWCGYLIAVRIAREWPV